MHGCAKEERASSSADLAGSSNGDGLFPQHYRFVRHASRGNIHAPLVPSTFFDPGEITWGTGNVSAQGHDMRPDRAPAIDIGLPRMNAEGWNTHQCRHMSCARLAAN